MIVSYKDEDKRYKEYRKKVFSKSENVKLDLKLSEYVKSEELSTIRKISNNLLRFNTLNFDFVILKDINEEFYYMVSLEDYYQQVLLGSTNYYAYILPTNNTIVKLKTLEMDLGTKEILDGIAKYVKYDRHIKESKMFKYIYSFYTNYFHPIKYELTDVRRVSVEHYFKEGLGWNKPNENSKWINKLSLDVFNYLTKIKYKDIKKDSFYNKYISLKKNREINSFRVQLFKQLQKYNLKVNQFDCKLNNGDVLTDYILLKETFHYYILQDPLRSKNIFKINKTEVKDNICKSTTSYYELLKTKLDIEVFDTLQYKEVRYSDINNCFIKYLDDIDINIKYIKRGMNTKF